VLIIKPILKFYKLKTNNFLLLLQTKKNKIMDKQQTIEQLKDIIKPYIQNQEAFDTLTEDTDFINDLKINSANLVDVILDIEEKYNIIIDNESMEQMVNVKAAMQIIDTKLS
jgi:acyl carrier protein